MALALEAVVQVLDLADCFPERAFVAVGGDDNCELIRCRL